MITSLINKIINRLGYEIHKKPNIVKESGVEFHSYLKSDGSFDYDKYRQIQMEGNKRKIGNVWVKEENIAFLSDYLKKNIRNIEFGLCHGTRQGKEQKWFRDYLTAEVIGTEISDTAEQFPNTIQWDFHEYKEEWIENVDFIYSNSFDHSYDPKKCLTNWMKCLKKDGICILEHSSDHETATELDPFGADISQMPYLILNWGGGKYYVTEILDAPAKSNNLKYLKYLIIRKQ